MEKSLFNGLFFGDFENMKIKPFLYSLLSIFFTSLLIGQNSGSKSMNLHDYMEDYMESAEKSFKKGNKEPLEKILKNLPSLAPEADREEWEKITTAHLEKGDLLKSCKSCHTKFKKTYKKTFRKKILEIPQEMLIE
mgnify:CR=1 FL=1